MINHMIADTTYEKLCDRIHRAVTPSQEGGAEHRRKKSEAMLRELPAQFEPLLKPL